MLSPAFAYLWSLVSSLLVLRAIPKFNFSGAVVSKYTLCPLVGPFSSSLLFPALSSILETFNSISPSTKVVSSGIKYLTE